MYIYHTAIFYPDIELTMTAQTKENASALVDSKWREISKFYPMINNELNGEPRISKDKATISFKSGGFCDTLPNTQGVTTKMTAPYIYKKYRKSFELLEVPKTN